MNIDNTIEQIGALSATAEVLQYEAANAQRYDALRDSLPLDALRGPPPEAFPFVVGELLASSSARGATWCLSAGPELLLLEALAALPRPPGALICLDPDTVEDTVRAVSKNAPPNLELRVGRAPELPLALDPARAAVVVVGLRASRDWVLVPDRQRRGLELLRATVECEFLLIDPIGIPTNCRPDGFSVVPIHDCFTDLVTRTETIR